MDYSFIQIIDALTLCIFLFFGMLAMVIIGRLAGKVWRKEEGEPKGGVGSLHSALFGLSAFILAFTFGMSATRYNNVRDITAEEAYAIETALLRADLYSDSVRAAFHEDFKKYIDARLAYYNNVTDTVLFRKARNNAANVGAALWLRAVQQAKLPNRITPSDMMIPALNTMFEKATAVETTLFARVPDMIVYMLFILALVTSFVGGFTSSGIRRKDWIIIVTFALFLSMVTYVTLDLSRPMRGFIKANIGMEVISNIRKKL